MSFRNLTLEDIPVDLIQAVFHDDPADLTPEERAFIWELIQADLERESHRDDPPSVYDDYHPWADRPETVWFHCNWLTPEGSEEWEAIGDYPDYDMEDHIYYPPPF